VFGRDIGNRAIALRISRSVSITGPLICASRGARPEGSDHCVSLDDLQHHNSLYSSLAGLVPAIHASPWRRCLKVRGMARHKVGMTAVETLATSSQRAAMACA